MNNINIVIVPVSRNTQLHLVPVSKVSTMWLLLSVETYEIVACWWWAGLGCLDLALLLYVDQTVQNVHIVLFTLSVYQSEQSILTVWM